MVKMNQLAKEDFNPDVLGAAIPGQSLTANPGQFPYEKPPLTSDPMEASEAILETMLKPHAKSSIGKLLDMGVSAEMLASSYVVGGVAEGLFDADVAEIIKPALIMNIVGIADDLGVEDINVLDTAPPKGMAEHEHLEMMAKVSPERFKKKMEKLDNSPELTEEDIFNEEEEEDESDMLMTEGFISIPMEEV